MADQKRVDFTGKDAGLNDLMDQYKRKADQHYAKMKHDADQLNLSLEKQAKFMEQQVEALEKQSRLMANRLRIQAKQDFDQETFAARNTDDRDQANAGYRTSIDEIDRRRGEDKEVVNLLRQMLNSNEDDEFVDEARNVDGCCGPILEILKRMEKELKDVNKNTALFSGAGAAAGAAGGSLFSRLFGGGSGGAGGAGGGGAGAPSGGAGGGHGGGHHGGMLKDLVRADIINNAFNKMAEMGMVTNENEMVGKMFGLGTQIAGTGASTLIGMGSGIPIVGGIFESMGAAGEKMSELMGNLMGSAKSRELEEFEEYEIPYLKMKAMTGQKRSLDLQSLGIERSKSVQLSIALAQAQMGKQGLLDRTGLVAGAEAGLGMDRGTLMNLAGVSRMTTGDMFTNMRGLYGGMRYSGLLGKYDKLPYHEAMQFQLGLAQQKGGSLELMNSGDLSGATMMMRGVGGGFADQRGLSRMMQIDSGLSRPGSDYQKARSFAALSKLNPNASYFELLEMQEKGIMQEGYLGAMLKQLEGEVGGGQNLMLGTMQEFGVSPQVARTLVEKFQKDRGYFDKFTGTTADAAKLAGYEGEFDKKIMDAGKYVTPMEKSMAKIADAFVESWDKGITEAFKLSGTKLAGELGKEFNRILHSNSANHHPIL